MKNIFRIMVLGGALATASCTDLETQPRQSLTPEVAFADVDGFEALGFTTYGIARAFNQYGQQMMIAPEIMADNLRIIANTGRYIGQEANADRAHMNLWTTQFWSGINTANIVLAQIDDVEGNDTQRARVKGEAHFMRALFYFDLARVYGYEPGKEVNGWDKAVILRTEPTLGFSNADFRARATNRQVYDLIISDLQTAINLLPTASQGTSGVYRASKGAAQALLARVFLYDSKFAEAEAAATQAMATFGISDAGVGLADADSYIAGFSTAPNPESLFEIEIRSNDWSTVDGVNNSVCSLSANVFASAQFIVTATDELIESYEEGDVRKDAWGETTRSGASGTVYRSNKWLGHKGDFLENLPIIRAAELFLIRAEARNRKQSPDDAGARADLNALRSKRGLDDVDAALSGAALFDQIMLERRQEFALEGHRWFDLKRNGLDITKAGNFENVPYSDYRLLAPLPTAELQLNDQLEQNPGYN
ncbi:RagB/SusD family nutrient uptake outer membrane protein [Algoriphagus sp. CAU 1675]|uniref:RagB/SusD family nutrient uptake outer membrane protein n=1 Tax=Algoriphagus sp. CAU 1675 TaxID=3032597 RepID=UPI0023DBB1AB|nr:RagB/SusD family nutrient uptake outer membrane protein [Algoriphagus sp. CAU 1675]MDF2157316.1 RagB/SusD family nutrient uptake outer membrane protein [Algoriphagus sp. CAU 1675]